MSIKYSASLTISFFSVSSMIEELELSVHSGHGINRRFAYVLSPERALKTVSNFIAIVAYLPLNKMSFSCDIVDGFSLYTN